MGIEQGLKRLGISFDTYCYQFSDWEKDDFFIEQFSSYIQGHAYQMVLSVNYSPLIAQICFENGIPYAAWIYDSPIHIRSQKELHFDTTHLFCFDRGQALNYQKQGIKAYHQRLAADPALFQRELLSAADRKQYGSQVSFVGQLYETDYHYYCGPLDDYQKGYLEGIIKSQGAVYGAYFLPEMITDSLLQGMNEKYAVASNGTVTISREELTYMLACEITSRERYLILALLSRHFQVKHYAGKSDERLNQVIYMGYADYEAQMPKIFACSNINLNITLKTIQTGIPLRVLDVLACGGFLISNYQEELGQYFRLGEELVVYQNVEELPELVAYYLDHADERSQIAERGRERIMKDFTYTEALSNIIKIVLGG